MPEYLAPGVFVEETSFRSKSIEGVSTTTTGFIGPTRYGPLELEPELITSLGEFERTYGSRLQLGFKGASGFHNYMWHAVRAFFEEGGKRLYISRVFRRLDDKDYTGFDTTIAVSTDVKPYNDGHAREQHIAAKPKTGPVKPGLNKPYLLLAARYPGASGNMAVRITLRVGQNILSYKGDTASNVGSLQDRDVVLIHKVDKNGVVVANSGRFSLASKDASGKWTFTSTGATPMALKDLEAKAPTPTGGTGTGGTGTGGTRTGGTETEGAGEEGTETEGAGEEGTETGGTRAGGTETGATPAGDKLKFEIRVITATVSLIPTTDSDTSLVWDGLALDPQHKRAGANDSLTDRFLFQDAQMPSRNRELPIFIAPKVVTEEDESKNPRKIEDWTGDGIALLEAILDDEGRKALMNLDSTDETRSAKVTLRGGNDGIRPSSGDYGGKEVEGTTRKTGLMQFQDLEDISIVAAPGATFGYETGHGDEAAAIVNALIVHCERMKYRIAVLDSGNKQTLQQVRTMRAKLDSSHAALYYPWVKVMDPVTRQPIDLPPSGFVAGIYARNDVRRAVYKAPANEVVTSAIGFESVLNTAQQEALNPEGINAFRFFEGRGLRLWGARTVSSDPEWKYVNLRRYFAYLERSIDKGTQWAVFEPNGPALWANIRRSIEDFLLNEWQSGALLGDRPDAAYFVKCDRSTMTQNDLDNGRLVCLVGVAPLRPAEFVIIRIGQWTGDRK